MEQLRGDVHLLERKWEDLKTKDTLLSLHRAFSIAVSRRDGTRSSQKKKASFSITDVNALQVYVDDEKDRRAIHKILAAWVTLQNILRDIQLVIFNDVSSKHAQHRKKIKGDLRHLEDIVEQQRCDHTHQHVKDAINEVPLDYRFCKWTKALSLVPKGLEYAHRIIAVVNTHFPDIETDSSREASDRLFEDGDSPVLFRRSTLSLDLRPSQPTIRRTHSSPTTSPSNITVHHTHHNHGIPYSEDLNRTTSTSSVININIPDRSVSRAHIENRVAVVNHEMEETKRRIEILEFELSGVRFELHEYRMTLMKVEVDAGLKEFYLKETMKEVQRLGGSKLRPPLTDCQMEDIAACLRDDFHIRLANILDIDLTEIEHDYPIVTCGLREVKVQILRRWREREGEGGTVERLIMGMMKGESLAGTAKDILDNLLGNN
ncbi:uncharacterized protein LOC144452294 isoform X2 [Glandiceps talaboti]